eukprot:CAMPEP_0202366854 /NCGR_PEP_ID=MMETSP1126-20121109/17301_1 /ASSEMBLY_ACC=CAM_ASM_000457 /TAXON_ID=3047 /ORGANISM="Dunaliella tertiolecta, Strain CCMP1320" /LENGTH=330 /DNA_ID=CAMNT_0048961991 /DNA_START=60 /DNA_END=1053 /DNA_ORIENTATION=+
MMPDIAHRPLEPQPVEAPLGASSPEVACQFDCIVSQLNAICTGNRSPSVGAVQQDGSSSGRIQEDDHTKNAPSNLATKNAAEYEGSGLLLWPQPEQQHHHRTSPFSSPDPHHTAHQASQDQQQQHWQQQQQQQQQVETTVSTSTASDGISQESSGARFDSIDTAMGDARSNGKSRGSRRSQAVKVKRRMSRSPSPRPSSVGCPQYTMHLYNPGEFNIFMLDTGACGSDIMLHARAIQELQMKGLGRSTTQYVRGVGGSTNTRVEMVDLPWIEVAGVRCHKVKCLYAKGISGLDISIYSAGILGGDLLARFEVIIDYARKRLGIRKQQGSC